MDGRLANGESLKSIARLHGVQPNQLRDWRRNRAKLSSTLVKKRSSSGGRVGILKPQDKFDKFYSWCIKNHAGRKLERPIIPHKYLHADAKDIIENTDDDTYFSLCLIKYDFEFLQKHGDPNDANDANDDKTHFAGAANLDEDDDDNAEGFPNSEDGVFDTATTKKEADENDKHEQDDDSINTIVDPDDDDDSETIVDPNDEYFQKYKYYN